LEKLIAWLGQSDRQSDVFATAAMVLNSIIRRPFVGALLLGYYDLSGRLIYAGRLGTGMRADQLEDLFRRLQPLQTDKMALDVAPPRSTRFGSPLVLSWVHWVRPDLVVEVKY
jgi:bifunctional non-homologous end joining protein LigD